LRPAPINTLPKEDKVAFACRPSRLRQWPRQHPALACTFRRTTIMI
jgi:hypothetical protein